MEENLEITQDGKEGRVDAWYDEQKDGRKERMKEEGKETLNDIRKERREISGNDRTEKMKEQGKRGNKRKLNCSPNHIKENKTKNIFIYFLQEHW